MGPGRSERTIVEVACGRPVAVECAGGAAEFIDPRRDAGAPADALRTLARDLAQRM
jgi:hypothetical protein